MVVFCIIPPTTPRLFPYLAGRECKLGGKERKKGRGISVVRRQVFPYKEHQKIKSFFKKTLLFLRDYEGKDREARQMVVPIKGKDFLFVIGFGGGDSNPILPTYLFFSPLIHSILSKGRTGGEKNWLSFSLSLSCYSWGKTRITFLSATG